MSHLRVLLLGSLVACCASNQRAVSQAPVLQPLQRNSSSREAPPSAAQATTVIGDSERSAVIFTAYDFDVHLRPEEASLSILARVKVRNDSAGPLAELPLQISSSLHWDSASQILNGRTVKLAFNQHQLQTDADHTGATSEAVLILATPLKHGEAAEFDLFYSGSIPRSSARLQHAGAAQIDAVADEWDLISSQETFLRGFGNVLWYPAASPQVFFGEGATLVQASGQQMIRQAEASVKLRLSVEYTGEAPGAVFFCGRQESLRPASDNADAPVAEAPGVATAEFPPQELGFRTPGLFVTAHPVLAPGTPISVVSSSSDAADRLSSAWAPAAVFLADWFGAGPAHALTVVDHPGASFADGVLLVAPVGRTEVSALTSVLFPSLIHARFRSRYIWLDQGITQLLYLLWVERTQGRSVALTAVEEQSHALALAESVTHPDNVDGMGLRGTSDAVLYRYKAAAVLWQVRDMVGDDALKQALRAYVLDSRLDHDPAGFEKAIEEASGKRLGWFFTDWVDHDRGLPDLSIMSVAPRELSSKADQSAGWLVAVEVRNDGGAAAEVPVTVRSGTLTATERLRINAHSVASTRIRFQGVPEQVQVNDGTVPEMVSSTHTQDIRMH